MPKLPRNFRINAIKLSKLKNYLLYAVGEIILVAIGILLALQVSNWNEEYNKGKRKEIYYNNLLNDLKADTFRIKSPQKKWREFIIEVDEFTSYSYNQENIDSLLARLELITIIFFSLSNFIGDTYSTLLMTNDINLFPDSIKATLVLLKNRQDQHLAATEHWQKLVSEYNIDQVKYRKPAELSLIANGKTREKLNTIEPSVKALRSWEQSVSARRRCYKVFLTNTDSIVRINKKLMNQIKQLQKRNQP
ncbi:MAG: DUF6090 family protein [Flammeovirgaceae bacterium]